MSRRWVSRGSPVYACLQPRVMMQDAVLRSPVQVAIDAQMASPSYHLMHMQVAIDVEMAALEAENARLMQALPSPPQRPTPYPYPYA